MSLVEGLYKKVAMPKVFGDSREDAELAHEWGLEKLQRLQENKPLSWLAGRMLTYTHPMLETSLWNLSFPNPFGLAAYDKNARVLDAIPLFGWGFNTIGGVLLNPQEGNPRPRMWRSQELQALCNWLGFASAGVYVVKERLENSPKSPIPIFLNIGKNKDASVEKAIQDYAEVCRLLWPMVDAIEANPSSPNTPGLRDYQNAEILKQLLSGLVTTNEEMSTLHSRPRKPIGVKVSPDETSEALQDIVDVAVEIGVDFLTLTNTTVSRDGLAGWDIPPDRGGVSGIPLAERAFRVLCEVHQELKRKNARNRIKLISVGGIPGGNELYNRITYGADLCEALTAWVFEGPDFPKRSLQTLVKRLQTDGFRHVSEAVGSAV